MSLTFPGGEPFVTGAAPYRYRPATAHETTPRIILTVAIEGLMTEAMVDTGGVYLLCHPHIARRLHLQDVDALSGIYTLLFRGVGVQGRLHRLQLTLLAEAGDNLDIQATAFVPEHPETEEWGSLPCILGLYGCLERVRFAVDPQREMFYFGPVAASF